MKWDTPEALAAYLEDNPTSDAMREAARTIRALEITRQEAAEVIVERNADVARLRALLDDHRIRDVLGYIEDAGPADVWACAQSWMVGRDAALSGESNP